MKSFSSSHANQSFNIELKDGKYTINGVTYNDFNDIPTEIKKAYQLDDRDGNGVPDKFDTLQEMAKDFPRGTSETKISINGKDYSSWDEVPVELRAQNEQIQKMMDMMMPNSTNILSKDFFPPAQSKVNHQAPSYVESKPQIPGLNSLNSESKVGNSLRWLLAIIALLFFLYFIFGDQIKIGLLN